MEKQPTGVEEQAAAVAHRASTVAKLGGDLLDAHQADVGAARERVRLRRLRTLAIVLGIPTASLWWRMFKGDPVVFGLPSMPQDPLYILLPVLLIVVLCAVIAMPLLGGRSPHVMYSPEQLDISFDDVKGLDSVIDEIIRTLNTFLGYAMFREELGGRPRRGLLFDGPPGTGKTHVAKAMAREAGVPFLFVSATSFQSMWYGATARKIRSFFKVLRKAAREHGGAIGFIEEIDAIGTVRAGMRSTPLGAPVVSGCQGAAPVATGCSHAAIPATPTRVDRMGTSEGTGGVVNELLVQMQSFDTPPFRDRFFNGLAGWVNGYLPPHRQIAKRKATENNILVIAATNRAEDLDPALLRPGRFDRRLEFEVPAKAARLELIDYFMSRKSHDPKLDEEDYRSLLANQTFGYTPVMIEHLLDEALVYGLKDGRGELSWSDIQEARLTLEVGLKNPVEYTDLERRTVATHEAGHATVAYLRGTRRLEVLSIIKRKGALGLLAHGDLEEQYTRSRKEMYSLIDIAMGGMVAEELFFEEAGTGPGGDLAAATQVACEIVGSAGMGSSLVSLAAVQAGALNGTNLVGRVLADAVARPEVERILAQAKAEARALLEANRHLVEALRDALLDRDELIGHEITDVLEAAGEPVLEGLVIDRREDTDRRVRDWLADAEDELSAT